MAGAVPPWPSVPLPRRSPRLSPDRTPDRSADRTPDRSPGRSPDRTPDRFPERPARRPSEAGERVRRWYENELGWPTVPGEPVRLSVGVRFDVLDVPAEAGRGALVRLPPGCPVALRGDRMALLVAAGSAEELPGLLRWLEWGGLPLDLIALGAGTSLEAPPPPVSARTRVCGPRTPGAGAASGSAWPAAGLMGAPRAHGVPGAGAVPEAGAVPDVATGRRAASGSPEPGTPVVHPVGTSQGAAVWLRPPVPGREVEASLPSLTALGRTEGAPDLVRLVETVATLCHRIRLRRASAQPLAFS
ncbi:SCO3374 family protein [Streptomyces thermocoprophilus]|uniref:SCO3374 family protein n=1 Tax=Streptomyces thermocoprophilus TaxID=78356 RepID=A0ABV5VJG5_9ACTN